MQTLKTCGEGAGDKGGRGMWVVYPQCVSRETYISNKLFHMKHEKVK